METTVIKPAKGWQPLDIQTLWKYRDLFIFLVWRDVKAHYAQSVLGIGWAVIQPVFNMLIFTVIFGNMVKVNSDGVPYPIFSYTALVPWAYFTAALTGSSGSLLRGVSMLSKVYFPRMVLPISSAVSKLVDFAIAFAIVIVMMLWYRILPNWNIVFLPFFILLMTMAASGLGMWLTCLGLQYRDINYSIGFFISALMYMTPVIYPLSSVPEKFHLAMSLNPMTGIIEGFRSALLGTGPMPWEAIGIGASTSIVLFISGMFYFQRQEKIFADVL